MAKLLSNRARLVDLVILLGTLAGIWLVLTTGGYTHFIIGLVAITAIACIGLNVLYGLTGLISLGQVGFLAIGAYATAILTLNGVSYWLAAPIAVLLSAFAGCLLAVPAVRMAGPFLAMVTIAFAFIVEHTAIEWRSLTGGQNGLMGFSNPSIGGYTFSEADLVMMAVVLCGLLTLGYRWVSDSGWGFAMKSLRDAEIAAQSVGYKPFTIKLIAFAIAAATAGLAGTLFAPLMGFIAPSNFPFSQSILYLFAVILGGAGTVLGPVVGALVTVLLPEFLSSLAEYRLLFFGGLLVTVLLLAPRGIVGTIASFVPSRPRDTAARPEAEIARMIEGFAGDTELAVENIAIAFGGVRAVDGVSFTAMPGEVTSIIGPNGAGKTTVLNIVSGFYSPDTGSVRVGTLDIAGKPPEFAAAHGVARTYQTTRLFESLSVVDNVVAALPNGALGHPFAALANAERRALAAGLLRYCGYAGEIDRRAGDLPHVDRRLVEVARSLATKPRVLLLDEPAAGLMRADKEALSGLLRRLADAGLAVILVEHDMDMVMGISDKILAVDAGSPIATGTASEVRKDPAVVAAYLGEGISADNSRAQPLETKADAVLETVNLTAGYGAAPVLKSVSLRVRPGEMVTLLGANGAGKSTFLSTLSGLLRPVEGNIILDDKQIQNLPTHAIVDRGLVLVPEGRQVFPELTVLENIELGKYRRGEALTAEERDKVFARFPRLKERMNQPAGLLSGGEQQMMAIARGLVANPRVLLLDEPSLGLAPALIEELYDILAELRDAGITILLVDQMATLALSVADYAYVIEQGEIVMEGSASELARDEGLIKAYLGEAEIAEPAQDNNSAA
ncbi:ATP-binding cassette domain-containing protein [Tepidamorphus sp. 3E244]|uniref:branched-chain amino acid ABC transporter ATP-binding protein/permease n=1 Tax=Tepidamorphus sp. 3E244 TaxID=3385498 RepID=UPI0038FC9130